MLDFFNGYAALLKASRLGSEQAVGSTARYLLLLMVRMASKLRDEVQFPFR